jgi:hypothetical protein
MQTGRSALPVIAGQNIVDAYNACSQPLAGFIAEHEKIRVFAREVLLDPVVFILDKSWLMDFISRQGQTALHYLKWPERNAPVIRLS